MAARRAWLGAAQLRTAVARRTSPFAAVSRTRLLSRVSTASSASVSDTAPPPSLNFYDTRTREAAAQRLSQLSVADLFAGANMDPVIVQDQLTVRIAKRLEDFQMLPFIVGCNPYLKKVHLMYADAFKKIGSMPKVTSKAKEAELSKLLMTFLDDHSNVLLLMATGCRECTPLIDRHVLNNFMDRTMFSRIGIRLLVEHHLSLSRLRKGYIGSIGLNQRLSDVAKRAIKVTTDMCIRTKGRAPKTRIQGQLDTTFTYTTAHVEYILSELLKNSFRATLDTHGRKSDGPLPDVVLTLAHNEREVMVRISDQGGGFPSSMKDKIWGYAVTTADQEAEEVDLANADPFGQLTADHSVMLAGQGVGLPVARTYAEYFNGSLELKSMYGYGVDAFLTVNVLHKDARHLVIHY